MGQSYCVAHMGHPKFLKGSSIIRGTLKNPGFKEKMMRTNVCSRPRTHIGTRLRGVTEISVLGGVRALRTKECVRFQ